MKALDRLRDLEARLDTVGSRARQEAADCGISVFYAAQDRDGVIIEITAKGEQRTHTLGERPSNHAAE